MIQDHFSGTTLLRASSSKGPRRAHVCRATIQRNVSLKPPPGDVKRPDLENFVFINNNVMKCKQKVTASPIPCPWAIKDHQGFRNLVSKG